MKYKVTLKLLLILFIVLLMGYTTIAFYPSWSGTRNNIDYFVSPFEGNVNLDWVATNKTESTPNTWVLPVSEDFDGDGDRELMIVDGTQIRIYDSSLDIEANIVWGSEFQSTPFAVDFLGNGRKQVVGIIKNDSIGLGYNFTVIDYNGSLINISKNFRLNTSFQKNGCSDAGTSTQSGIVKNTQAVSPIRCSGTFQNFNQTCYFITEMLQVVGFNYSSDSWDDFVFLKDLVSSGISQRAPNHDYLFENQPPIFFDLDSDGDEEMILSYANETCDGNPLNADEWHWVNVLNDVGVEQNGFPILVYSDLDGTLLRPSSNLNVINWNGGSDTEIVYMAVPTTIQDGFIKIIDLTATEIDLISVANGGWATNVFRDNFDGIGSEDLLVLGIENLGSVFGNLTVFVYEGGTGSEICEIRIGDDDGTEIDCDGPGAEFNEVCELLTDDGWKSHQITNVFGKNKPYYTFGDRLILVNFTGWSGNCDSSSSSSVVRRFGSEIIYRSSAFPLDLDSDTNPDFVIDNPFDDITQFHMSFGLSPEEEEEEAESQNIAPDFQDLVPLISSVFVNDPMVWTATVFDNEGDIIYSAVDCDITDGVSASWFLGTSGGCTFSEVGTFQARYWVTDGRGIPSRWGEEWFSNASAFKNRNVTVIFLVDSTCGNSICDAPETFDNCPIDCPQNRTGNLGTPTSLDLPLILVDSSDPFNSGLFPEVTRSIVFLFSQVAVPAIIISLLAGSIGIGLVIIRKVNQ